MLYSRMRKTPFPHDIIENLERADMNRLTRSLFIRFANFPSPVLTFAIRRIPWKEAFVKRIIGFARVRCDRSVRLASCGKAYSG